MKKVLWALMGMTLTLTVCLACIYLQNLPARQHGNVEIKTVEKSITAELNCIPTQLVEGSIVNGKGEKIRIQGQGIPVSEFFREVGIETFDRIKVTANDAYSAELKQEEAEKDACFMISDGELELVVFSDTNRKRNVANIVLIEVS